MTGSPSNPVAPPLTPSDERLWASLAHFGNILGFLPSLLILLILGPRSARVRAEAREALNFVITIAIGSIALVVIGAILSGAAGAAPSGVALVLGLLALLVGLLQFALYLLLVVFSIVAGVRVNQGGSYRYPFALRLVK